LVSDASQSLVGWADAGGPPRPRWWASCVGPPYNWIHPRLYRRDDLMNLREFRCAGHFPTLICAFLYFDVSFMVWVLIGSLGVSISAHLGFDPVTDAAKKGLMVAVPLLGGSLLRLVLGLLTDHIGARRTAIMGMTLTAIPLL